MVLNIFFNITCCKILNICKYLFELFKIYIKESKGFNNFGVTDYNLIILHWFKKNAMQFYLNANPILNNIPWFANWVMIHVFI